KLILMIFSFGVGLIKRLKELLSDQITIQNLPTTNENYQNQVIKESHFFIKNISSISLRRLSFEQVVNLFDQTFYIDGFDIKGSVNNFSMNISQELGTPTNLSYLLTNSN
ncbi:hypothetical protein HC766_04705, partial [Candidatus Gracilibacteria bacterium]|nr:hypothetical protein [Candidatus Gracilibacteria bacterium]